MVESDKECKKKELQKKSESDRLIFKRHILDIVKSDNHLKVLLSMLCFLHVYKIVYFPISTETLLPQINQPLITFSAHIRLT